MQKHVYSNRTELLSFHLFAASFKYRGGSIILAPYIKNLLIFHRIENKCGNIFFFNQNRIDLFRICKDNVKKKLIIYLSLAS